MDVREDARGDSAEERGAVRGSLLGRCSLERQIEDGRNDPKPEGASGAAARDARELGFDAELPEELERVTERVGDALEHGADQGATVVAERQSGEGAARVGIEVRCPLAAQVREEDEPLHAGRPALCLGHERVERLARRDGVA